MPILGKTVKIKPTLTVDTSAYADGDVVGGLITFPKGDLGAGGGITIRQAYMVDDDDEKQTLTLWLFDDEPSTIADNAAFAPTVDDLKKLRGKITFSAWTTENSNAYVIVEAVDISIDTVDGLYGYLVAGGAVTYTAATDLTLTLVVWQD